MISSPSEGLLRGGARLRVLQGLGLAALPATDAAGELGASDLARERAGEPYLAWAMPWRDEDVARGEREGARAKGLREGKRSEDALRGL